MVVFHLLSWWITLKQIGTHIFFCVCANLLNMRSIGKGCCFCVSSLRATKDAMCGDYKVVFLDWRLSNLGALWKTIIIYTPINIKCKFLFTPCFCVQKLVNFRIWCTGFEACLEVYSFPWLKLFILTNDDIFICSGENVRHFSCTQQFA